MIFSVYIKVSVAPHICIHTTGSRDRWALEACQFATLAGSIGSRFSERPWLKNKVDKCIYTFIHPDVHVCMLHM